MALKKTIILLILFNSINLFAQEQLEIGEHIYEDKLTYITLINNNEFEYLKYYKWSPLTIEEERKAKNSKNDTCGTIGYVSGAKGKGKFKFRNGKLILKFTDFKLLMDNKTNFKKETKTMEFIISKFIN